MESDEVLAWLRARASAEERAGMSRFGIPNENAHGVPMGVLKAHAKSIGRSHALASALWASGWYEARTLAALVDDPEQVSELQMDRWAGDFDSWAICDTTCFHLFDRTPHAWSKVEAWANDSREFVKRASFALIWSLSVHDKRATDARFLAALELIEGGAADERPLVKKAVDMALRATGKRNAALNRAAARTAKRMVSSDDKNRAWVGRNSLKELESDKVRSRFA